MENLAINHIYMVLGIAGLISMLATGCAIQAGDVLYRRFTRKAIERELKKGMVPLVAICLAFLLTSQMAYGQTPYAQAPPKKIGHYKKLFMMSTNLAAQTKNICKTEACAKAADELTAIVANGQDKYKKGTLVQETRKQWNVDHIASLKKLRATLVDSLPEGTKKTLANRQLIGRLQLRPVQDTSEECALCDEVLEKTSAICMLYELQCPTCTLICIATAGIAYARCIEDYCGDPSADNGGDGGDCGGPGQGPCTD